MFLFLKKFHTIFLKSESEHHREIWRGVKSNCHRINRYDKSRKIRLRPCQLFTYYIQGHNNGVSGLVVSGIKHLTKYRNTPGGGSHSLCTDFGFEGRLHLEERLRARGARLAATKVNFCPVKVLITKSLYRKGKGLLNSLFAHHCNL